MNLRHPVVGTNVIVFCAMAWGFVFELTCVFARRVCSYFPYLSVQREKIWKCESVNVVCANVIVLCAMAREFVQPIPLGVTFSNAVSKLKAPSTNVSFHWNVAKETVELWALSFQKWHPKWDWLYTNWHEVCVWIVHTHQVDVSTFICGKDEISMCDCRVCKCDFWNFDIRTSHIHRMP